MADKRTFEGVGLPTPPENRLIKDSPPRSSLVLTFLLIAVVVVALAFFNATIETAHYFIETGVTNGVGDCHYLDGDYAVTIYGTFDNAVVSLQYIVEGSCPLGIVKIKDVGVPALVAEASETEAEPLSAGAGYYRLLVSGGLGGESISMRVARKSN